MTPPPLGNNTFIVLNISIYNITVLLINEEENSIKIKYTRSYEWYNSYITFQNLKNDTQNLLSPEDKDIMWLPFVELSNVESIDKCRLQGKFLKKNSIFTLHYIQSQS